MSVRTCDEPDGICPPPQLSAKAKESLRKVNLTRLKGKAEGKAGIPEPERFYLDIKSPRCVATLHFPAGHDT